MTENVDIYLNLVYNFVITEVSEMLKYCSSKLQDLSYLSYLVDLLLIIVALMWMFDEQFIIGFIMFILVELREINRNVKIKEMT